MKRKPKILIFGASGFMGSHLVSEFLKNKLEVIAFTRCKKKIKRKSKYLKVVEADLLKPHSYQEYLKEPCLIYYLVHGMSETDEFIEFYNKERLHGSLSYRPPEEFERLFNLGELEGRLVQC